MPRTLIDDLHALTEEAPDVVARAMSRIEELEGDLEVALERIAILEDEIFEADERIAELRAGF